MSDEQTPTDQKRPVVIEFASGEREQVQVDSEIWGKVEQAAFEHGNTVGEELTEILDLED